MKNYQCKKCKTHLTGNSTPSGFNCPGGGNHQWTDLGEVGTSNYQCKKCGTLVQSKNTPSGFNCPSDGNHQWTKLN
jgi:DNA-directed RNA polymerase subunit RPC12/RpoP